MRTVILEPLPRAVEELIAERRRIGIDTYDEVWDGELHLAQGPSFEHGRVEDELAAALRRPATRTVRLWQRDDGGGLVETGASALLEVTSAELEAEIDWPA